MSMLATDDTDEPPVAAAANSVAAPLNVKPLRPPSIRTTPVAQVESAPPLVRVTSAEPAAAAVLAKLRERTVTVVLVPLLVV